MPSQPGALPPGPSVRCRRSRRGVRLGEMFEEDLRGAGEIQPGESARRPWWQKAAEIAAGSFHGNL
ncbi:MAG: hypothetical protein JHC52_08265 [Chthoniobacterales bacterium]|nr:hypothetical protein [Chthoniobacterales bacterium]